MLFSRSIENTEKTKAALLDNEEETTADDGSSAPVKTTKDEQLQTDLGDDLRSMTRVMRKLNFVDHNNIVQLKGRMACELSSGDEILMGELVFRNYFENMEADHIIALCSCFVFDERSSSNDGQISRYPHLVQAFENLKNTATEVAKAKQEARIPIDVEEYVDKLKPQMMDIVMSWLEGYKFVDMMENCDLYEGSIVRVIRRLDELVRELAGAAKTIGNVELEKKLSEGRERLKRGIIFAASLYL